MSGAEWALSLGMSLLFLLFPIGIHYTFTRHADGHFEEIISFLEEVAEAKVLSVPMGPGR